MRASVAERMGLVPHRVIAQRIGVSTSRVQKLEQVALAKVREALRRLGYDGSEVPYVLSALARCSDEPRTSHGSKRERKEYDRQRWLRRKVARRP